jgi:hypothetical protein
MRPPRLDARVLDQAWAGMDLINRPMGQRRELAVDLADHCSPGRRRTGRRRQAWRALTRGRPASARGAQRQREDEAHD